MGTYINGLMQEKEAGAKKGNARVNITMIYKIDPSRVGSYISGLIENKGTRLVLNKRANVS